jgi:hypothetical protein
MGLLSRTMPVVKWMVLSRASMPSRKLSMPWATRFTYVLPFAIAIANFSCSREMSPQIMFDSGVRSAADIFKAIALGAKFVFIGRMWIWGLSIAGEHGKFHQTL